MEKGKTGLVYNKDSLGNDTSWIFDDSSTETWGSSWHNFSYEFIFRPEEIRATDKVIEELKEVFIESFGLPSDHFSFSPTFWYVYWDKSGWRASMLKKCEKALDKVAKKHSILIRFNGLIIQPRPMGYIDAQIKHNN